jgi:hypothetical protein
VEKRVGTLTTTDKKTVKEFNSLVQQLALVAAAKGNVATVFDSLKTQLQIVANTHLQAAPLVSAVKASTSDQNCLTLTTDDLAAENAPQLKLPPRVPKKRATRANLRAPKKKKSK